MPFTPTGLFGAVADATVKTGASVIGGGASVVKAGASVVENGASSLEKAADQVRGHNQPATDGVEGVVEASPSEQGSLLGLKAGGGGVVGSAVKVGAFAVGTGASAVKTGASVVGAGASAVEKAAEQHASDGVEGGVLRKTMTYLPYKY